MSEDKSLEENFETANARITPGVTIGGMGEVSLPNSENGNIGSGDVPDVADIDDDEEEAKKDKTKKKLEMEGFKLFTQFDNFVTEGKFDDIGDLVKSLHFEIDPKTAEEKKIELGERQGEVVPRKQIEGGNYSLRRFRKEIKYDETGEDLGVFKPGSYMAATSKLGDGPHKKAVKKVKWNQKMYDQWLEDVASNGGWEHAFDMAQNAKHERGLIDWVKKNHRGEDPMQRIQWDIEAFAESVVTEAKAYKLKASEFGADTHSAAYNVKGEPTWRVHSTYAIDQVSGDNNPEERDVVFFEAMPINKDIYIKIGGINNLKRSNGSTYGKNFGTTIEEWEKDPKGIAKEASNFLTDADHLKWINKKARSEGQKIKWALKDNYANVIEDLVNKSLELTESVVNEANDMSAKKLSKYAGFKEVEYEGAVYAFTSKELGKMQFQAEPSFKTIDGNLRDDELNLEVDRSMAKTAHAKVLGQIRGYKNIIAFLKGGGAEKYESGSLKEIEKYVKKFNFKSISESVTKDHFSEYCKLNEAKSINRDEMMDWIGKYMKFVGTSEEFNGSEGGIHLSGEDGAEYKGAIIYSYYSEDYKNREFGVWNKWEKELNKRGWYSEWYDAGTVCVWPL